MVPEDTCINREKRRILLYRIKETVSLIPTAINQAKILYRLCTEILTV